MKKKILFSLLTLTSFMPIALMATKCKENKKENEKQNKEDNDKLTQSEVEKQTTISIENITNRKIEDIKKEDINIKGPEKWNLSIKKIEIQNNTLIATIEAKCKDKTYEFKKTLSGFKNLLNDVEISLKNPLNHTDIVNKDKYNQFYASDFTFKDIDVKSKNSEYKYEHEIDSYNDEEGILRLKITKLDKDDKKLESKLFEISGFKKKIAANEKDAEFNLKLLSPEQFKNKYSSDILESDVDLKSKSNLYTYKITGLEYDDVKGKLSINYRQYQASDNKLLGAFTKEYDSFKKLEPKQDDLKTSVRGLEESQFSTKTAEEAAKLGLDFQSKSGKYEYIYKGKNINNSNGTITITVTQKALHGSKEFNTFTYVLQGFKKA